MATARARRLHEETGKRVAFGDGRVCFWDRDTMLYNPRISTTGKEGVWCDDYPRHRPYIVANDKKRIQYNDQFRPEPGEIWLAPHEKREKGGYILIEPNTKPTYLSGQNKAWIGRYWEELVKADLPWKQCGPKGTVPLVDFTPTATFREALSVLSGASLYVGTDGGLHHAAAALGIPAVVIWTGYSSPRHLGYDAHANIHDGGDPCGIHGEICPHCRKIAESITPDQVLATVEGEYEKHSRNLAA